MVFKKEKKKIEEQAEKYLAVNQSDANIYFFLSLIKVSHSRIVFVELCCLNNCTK